MIICTCCSKSMKSHKIGVAVLEMDDRTAFSEGATPCIAAT